MTHLRLAPVAVMAFLAACRVGTASSSPPPAPGRAAAAVAAAPGAFHYSRPLQAPRALHLYGLAGGVVASPSKDGNVDVRAAVRGEHPERVRIVAREEARGVVVCVLYADESPDACRFDGVSRSRGDHDDGREPRVDLFARVPRGVLIDANTIDGGVQITSPAAEASATTVNGNIEIVTSGAAKAETVNGNVAIRLAQNVDAEIGARTVSGEIRSNFPMTIDTLPFGFGPKSGHATLGRGGARVEASTVNGDIDVTRGS